MKINSKVHGIIDYLSVLFLWLSPSIFSLPHTSSVFAYALGTAVLALSICTNYEYGLVKFIPLKVHGTADFVVVLASVAAALYLESIEGEFARNYYIGVAVVVFLIWLLSDFTNKPKETQEVPYIESNTDGAMI